ncbi:hypothetical protein ACLB2K_034223 [Fragaria x ananassa]
MTVGLVGQQKQDDGGGFVVLSSPPPLPTTIMPSSAPVSSSSPPDYLNQVVSDDERSDHGGYRKLIPPQPQQQQSLIEKEMVWAYCVPTVKLFSMVVGGLRHEKQSVLAFEFLKKLEKQRLLKAEERCVDVGRDEVYITSCDRFSSSIVSGLSQGNGKYFTGIGIGVGSPPKYLYMVLDTGSDVVWLQCAPCKRCYSQTDPVFDPRKSSSFSSFPCSSPLCRHLDSPGCSSL